MNGCGESAPQDFPQVFSCHVKVVEGGTPIEGVSVTLIPAQVIPSVSIGGVTDGSGTAVIKTRMANYGQNGVPEGDYTVMFSKTLPVDMPSMTPEESYKLSDHERAALEKEYQQKLEAARVVPKVLSGSASPVKLQINTSGGNLEVDINDYKK